MKKFDFSKEFGNIDPKYIGKQSGNGVKKRKTGDQKGGAKQQLPV